jgi:hypothetical protein
LHRGFIRGVREPVSAQGFSLRIRRVNEHPRARAGDMRAGSDR